MKIWVLNRKAIYEWCTGYIMALYHHYDVLYLECHLSNPFGNLLSPDKDIDLLGEEGHNLIPHYMPMINQIVI